MRKSRFSGLGGVMRGQADMPAPSAQTPKNPPAKQPGDDDDEDEPEAGDGSSNEETSMSDKPDLAAVDAARTEGHAAGFKAANERLSTVLASEHYAGREQLAQNLLGNASMDAEAIISALAAAPKASASDDDANAEDAARSEMRAAIDETNNSDVDAAGGGSADKTDKAKAASEAWRQVYADLGPKR